MKRLPAITLLFFVAAAPSLTAENFAIAPKISTLGYGADLVVGMGRYLQARVGATTGSISRELEQSDIEYDGEADFSTQNLLLDIYPAAGAFRFTIGAIRNENVFEGRTTEDTVVELNGTNYPISQVGRIRAEVRPEDLGPYVGIGFGNVLAGGSRFRFLLDIGAYYHGEPTVDLIAEPNPGVPLPPRFEEDLAAEEAAAQEDVKDYDIYPVVSFSLAIRF